MSTHALWVCPSPMIRRTAAGCVAALGALGGVLARISQTRPMTFDAASSARQSGRDRVAGLMRERALAGEVPGKP
jgi:hypothetical protein